MPIRASKYAIVTAMGILLLLSARTWSSEGQIRWSNQAGTIPGQSVNGGKIRSPAIGTDGRVYVTGSSNFLQAMSPQLGKIWSYQFCCSNDLISAPVVAADGVIYVGRASGIYAINPDGSLKWGFGGGGTHNFTVPAIALDGTVYVSADNVGTASGIDTFYALHPDGTVFWSYPLNSTPSPPSVAADGTVYVGDVSRLYALTVGGLKSWEYFVGEQVTTPPSIDGSGNLYFGAGSYLYSLTANGSFRWKYYTGDIVSPPAIDENGIIYIGGTKSQYSGALYALYPGGTLKWEYDLDGIAEGSPAIAGNGVVYIGSNATVYSDNTTDHLYAINENGTLRWKFAGAGALSSPSIAADGTVYVGSESLGYVYAVQASSPLATAPWPKFGYGLKNTGSIDSSTSPLNNLLAVTKPQNGRVTSNPVGINCGGAHNQCSAYFSKNASVKLNPIPASTHVFDGWGGDCSGTGDCILSMASNRSVSASFRHVDSGGSEVVVTPFIVDFGTVRIGKVTPIKSVHIGISSGVTILPVSQWNHSPGSFRVVSGDCPALINGTAAVTFTEAGSCTLDYEYLPSQLGEDIRGVNVPSNADSAPDAYFLQAMVVSALEPDPPTITSLGSDDGEILVRFVVNDDGGAPITQFTATCGSHTSSSSTSPIRISELTNGVSYPCSVTATNSVGTSQASGVIMATPMEQPLSALNIILIKAAIDARSAEP